MGSCEHNNDNSDQKKRQEIFWTADFSVVLIKSLVKQKAYVMLNICVNSYLKSGVHVSPGVRKDVLEGTRKHVALIKTKQIVS
jgi:hypothetical protein